MLKVWGKCFLYLKENSMIVAVQRFFLITVCDIAMTNLNR